MTLFSRLTDGIELHLKELLKGTAIALTLRGSGLICITLFNLILARILGPEKTGLFFLSFNMAILGTVFGRLGLDNAMLKYTAANSASENWYAVAGIYRKGITISGLSSCAITILILILAPTLCTHVFHDNALIGPMRIMALAIMPLSLTNLHSEMLRGLKRIRDSLLVYWQGLILPIISLCLLIIFVQKFGLAGAVTSYLAASFITLGVAYILWRNATPQLEKQPGGFDTKILMDTALPLFWVSSTHIFMTSIDTFMLGIFLDARSVGIYSVALKTAGLISYSLTAASAIAAPKFAALHASGDHETLASFARTTTKFVIFLSAPLLILFLTAPELILGIFGPEFKGASVAFIILSLGQFVNVSVGLVVYLLTMSGHHRVIRNIFFGCAFINLLLNSFLIPRFGVNGAAVATALSIATLNLAALQAVRNRLFSKKPRFHLTGSG